ncbi:MAG TPA: AAA family ATPase [Candidatus Faecaligallichristensenella faecipullorum]|nr:AAA family ATPase [Candidatus Faecaligallichristensenella faecipullorum]
MHKKLSIGLAVILGAGLLAWLAMAVLGLDAQRLDTAGKWLCGLAIVLFVAAMLNKGRAAVPAHAGDVRFEPASEASRLSFLNVAANEEALNSLKELADFLKNPQKYQRMGARMPRGVLLYGPPGTGKTLMARALAGEAGVPFFAASGADFVQMYVGVGASRVRELFAKARKAGKSVIFIDEIDALGKARQGSGSDEREQTLNALLVEMSGFREENPVVVLAATNRLDTLDPALLRPGRFDRQIEVGLPDRDQRLSILKLHSRNKPLAQEVNLARLASDTISFSGAALECLLNEAAILAAGRNAEQIELADVQRAYVTSIAGQDRPSNNVSQEDKAIIALHEAGHALVTHLLLPEHQIKRVSILPSTRGAAGYSLSIPPEKSVMKRSYLNAQLKVLLGGRAAEELAAGEMELTSGASDDLKRAAELAAFMVMDMGMETDHGIALRALSKACSAGSQEGFAQSRKLLKEAYGQTFELLRENSDLLMKLTEAILEKESMDEHQLEQIWQEASKP